VWEPRKHVRLKGLQADPEKGDQALLQEQSMSHKMWYKVARLLDLAMSQSMGGSLL